MTRILIGFLTLATLSCASGTPAMARLPVDQGGVSYQSRGNPFMDATQGCIGHLRVSGRVDLKGVVGGRRVQARLWFGIMMGAAARLETVEGSTRAPFVFSALGEDATVFLSAKNSVVRHEPAAAILEAVLGIPVGAATLERLFACPPAGSGSGGSSERMGDGWLRASFVGNDGPIDAYLRQTPPRDEWSLVAIIGRTARNAGWRADYYDQRNGAWTRVRLTSVDWVGRTGLTFDVDLSLHDLQVNSLFDQAALAATVPVGAQAMSLDQLRGSGSLLSNSNR